MITFSVNPVGDTKSYTLIDARSNDLEKNLLGEFFEKRNDERNIVKTFETFVKDNANRIENYNEQPTDDAHSSRRNAGTYDSYFDADSNTKKEIAGLFKLVFDYIESQEGKNIFDLVFTAFSGAYSDSNEKERGDARLARKTLKELMDDYGDFGPILLQLRPNIDMETVLERYNEGVGENEGVGDPEIRLLEFNIEGFIMHFSQLETYFVSKN